jgi:ubiquinone/menaquinone biosynthesis C-methylase UbiE
MRESMNYWEKVFGVEVFKVAYYTRWIIYKLFNLKLPKFRDQRKYWEGRAETYMQEFLNSGYSDREGFFQNLLIDQLREMDFDSCFEAGCGFGWNVKRVKEVFPDKKVYGLDFSITQLRQLKPYIAKARIPVVNGDNCYLPLKDNAIDVGLSIGVFMSIHPNRIELALKEMIRVCRKYIIHLEWDENHATSSLREQRTIKRNIVSYDYVKKYEALGRKVFKFATYKDFGEEYEKHLQGITTNVDRWEGYEGPSKYILIVIKVQTLKYIQAKIACTS